MSAKAIGYFETNVGIFRYFALLAVIFYAPNVGLLFSSSQWVLAVIYIFLALLVVSLAIYVQKTKRTKFAIQAFIFIAMATLLPWQITGGIGGTGLIWLFAYIIFAILLADIKMGSFWIATAYLLSFGIFALQLAGVLPLPYTVAFMLNFYFASAICYLLIVIFARARNDLERELSKQKLVLEEAQTAAKIGSWEWDIKKDEIVWSDLIKKMFGLSEAQGPMDYKQYISLILPDDRAEAGRIIQDALETGAPFSFEHRVKRPDGKEVWIHGEGSFEVDQQRMRGTAQDITERKKTELALIAQNQQLKRAEKLMIGREEKMMELKARIKQLESGGTK